MLTRRTFLSALAALVPACLLPAAAKAEPHRLTYRSVTVRRAKFYSFACEPVFAGDTFVGYRHTVTVDGIVGGMAVRPA